jgi:biotin transport system substrate-specific component
MTTANHGVTARALVPALLAGVAPGRRLLVQGGAAALGSWLIALGAQAQVPMWPVPATMQTFAVVLIGAALGARWGAASVLLYLAQGAAGLPFFAGGGAGIGHFAGPTGGYLLAFVLGAALVGALAERGWTRKAWTTALAMFAGELVILAVGALWLSALVGAREAFGAGMLVFLPWAAVKALLAAAALPAAWKMMR